MSYSRGHGVYIHHPKDTKYFHIYTSLSDYRLSTPLAGMYLLFLDNFWKAIDLTWYWTMAGVSKFFFLSGN